MMDVTDGAVQVFAFDDLDVRVVLIDGEPWWVAADVAKVLGFDKASRVARLVDDDERGDHEMVTPSGMQRMSVLSEPGLYSVVLRSNKPDAKRFKRWVTHVVLPAILIGKRAERLGVGLRELRRSRLRLLRG